MKKMIIMSVVGVMLGMAVAVWMVIAREKQARAAAPPPVVDSLAPQTDSLPEHVALVHPDSAHADSLFSDSAYAAAHQPADSLLGGEGAYVSAIAAGAPRPDSLVAEVAAANSAAGPNEQRLARIFAAMRPEEAARVLEQMSDPEVRRLLSHLRERQAAAIMSSISPARAAVISSALIRGERSSP